MDGDRGRAQRMRRRRRQRRGSGGEKGSGGAERGDGDDDSSGGGDGEDCGGSEREGSGSSSGRRGGSPGSDSMCPTSEGEGASDGLVGGASERRKLDGEPQPSSHAARGDTSDTTSEIPKSCCDAADISRKRAPGGDEHGNIFEVLLDHSVSVNLPFVRSAPFPFRERRFLSISLDYFAYPCLSMWHWGKPAGCEEEGQILLSAHHFRFVYTSTEDRKLHGD